MKSADDVHRFWFEEHTSADWFGGKPAFDKELEDAYGATVPLVARGDAWTWRTSPRGRLSEILVLDQFSRQLYRDDPRAFAQDGMALVLAQELVAAGHDQALPDSERMFAYMPFMHSESPVVHEQSIRLFTALGNETFLDYAVRHFEIIKKFGRYPKRNALLGRTSTPEEEAYIAERADAAF